MPHHAPAVCAGGAHPPVGASRGRPLPRGATAVAGWDAWVARLTQPAPRRRLLIHLTHLLGAPRSRDSRRRGSTAVEQRRARDATWYNCEKGSPAGSAPCSRSSSSMRWATWVCSIPRRPSSLARLRSWAVRSPAARSPGCWVDAHSKAIPAARSARCPLARSRARCTSSRCSDSSRRRPTWGRNQSYSLNIPCVWGWRRSASPPSSLLSPSPPAPLPLAAPAAEQASK